MTIDCPFLTQASLSGTQTGMCNLNVLNITDERVNTHPLPLLVLITSLLLGHSNSHTRTHARTQECVLSLYVEKAWRRCSMFWGV